MKFFLCLLAAGSLAVGGTITNPDTIIEFVSNLSSSEDLLSASVNTAGSGGYIFSGTACFDGYCPGQGTPGAGPNYSVNDPLTMRATAISLTCMSATCGAGINMFFDFSMDFVDPPAGSIEAVTVNLDGTGPAGSVLSVDGGVATCGSPCSSILSVVQIPNTSITANGSGMFSQTLNLGNLTFLGTELKVGLNLNLTNALTTGQTITLPNSASVSFTTVAASAPEPSSAALIAVGFALLGFQAIRRIGGRK